MSNLTGEFEKLSNRVGALETKDIDESQALSIINKIYGDIKITTTISASTDPLGKIETDLRVTTTIRATTHDYLVSHADLIMGAHFRL